MNGDRCPPLGTITKLSFFLSAAAAAAVPVEAYPAEARSPLNPLRTGPPRTTPRPYHMSIE